MSCKCYHEHFTIKRGSLVVVTDANPAQLIDGKCLYSILLKTEFSQTLIFDKGNNGKHRDHVFDHVCRQLGTAVLESSARSECGQDALRDGKADRLKVEDMHPLVWVGAAIPSKYTRHRTVLNKEQWQPEGGLEDVLLIPNADKSNREKGEGAKIGKDGLKPLTIYNETYESFRTREKDGYPVEIWIHSSYYVNMAYRAMLMAHFGIVQYVLVTLEDAHLVEEGVPQITGINGVTHTVTPGEGGYHGASTSWMLDGGMKFGRHEVIAQKVCQIGRQVGFKLCARTTQKKSRQHEGFRDMAYRVVYPFFGVRPEVECIRTLAPYQTIKATLASYLPAYCYNLAKGEPEDYPMADLGGHGFYSTGVAGMFTEAATLGEKPIKTIGEYVARINQSRLESKGFSLEYKLALIHNTFDYHSKASTSSWRVIFYGLLWTAIATSVVVAAGWGYAKSFGLVYDLLDLLVATGAFTIVSCVIAFRNRERYSWMMLYTLVFSGLLATYMLTDLAQVLDKTEEGYSKTKVLSQLPSNVRVENTIPWNVGAIKATYSVIVLVAIATLSTATALVEVPDKNIAFIVCGALAVIEAFEVYILVGLMSVLYASRRVWGAEEHRNLRLVLQHVFTFVVLIMISTVNGGSLLMLALSSYATGLLEVTAIRFLATSYTIPLTILIIDLLVVAFSAYRDEYYTFRSLWEVIVLHGERLYINFRGTLKPQVIHVTPKAQPAKELTMCIDNPEAYGIQGDVGDEKPGQMYINGIAVWGVKPMSNHDGTREGREAMVHNRMQVIRTHEQTVMRALFERQSGPLYTKQGYRLDAEQHDFSALILTQRMWHVHYRVDGMAQVPFIDKVTFDNPVKLKQALDEASSTMFNSYFEGHYTQKERLKLLKDVSLGLANVRHIDPGNMFLKLISTNWKGWSNFTKSELVDLMKAVRAISQLKYKKCLPALFMLAFATVMCMKTQFTKRAFKYVGGQDLLGLGAIFAKAFKRMAGIEVEDDDDYEKIYNNEIINDLRNVKRKEDVPDVIYAYEYVLRRYTFFSVDIKGKDASTTATHQMQEYLEYDEAFKGSPNWGEAKGGLINNQKTIRVGEARVTKIARLESGAANTTNSNTSFGLKTTAHAIRTMDMGHKEAITFSGQPNYVKEMAAFVDRCDLEKDSLVMSAAQGDDELVVVRNDKAEQCKKSLIRTKNSSGCGIKVTKCTVPDFLSKIILPTFDKKSGKHVLTMMPLLDRYFSKFLATPNNTCMTDLLDGLMRRVYNDMKQYQGTGHLDYFLTGLYHALLKKGVKIGKDRDDKHKKDLRFNYDKWNLTADEYTYRYLCLRYPELEQVDPMSWTVAATEFVEKNFPNLFGATIVLPGIGTLRDYDKNNSTKTYMHNGFFTAVPYSNFDDTDLDKLFEREGDDVEYTRVIGGICKCDKCALCNERSERHFLISNLAHKHLNLPMITSRACGEGSYLSCDCRRYALKLYVNDISLDTDELKIDLTHTTWVPPPIKILENKMPKQQLFCHNQEQKLEEKKVVEEKAEPEVKQQPEKKVKQHAPLLNSENTIAVSEMQWMGLKKKEFKSQQVVSQEEAGAVTNKQSWADLLEEEEAMRATPRPKTLLGALEKVYDEKGSGAVRVAQDRLRLTSTNSYWQYKSKQSTSSEGRIQGGRGRVKNAVRLWRFLKLLEQYGRKKVAIVGLTCTDSAGNVIVNPMLIRVLKQFDFEYEFWDAYPEAFEDLKGIQFIFKGLVKDDSKTDAFAIWYDLRSEMPHPEGDCKGVCALCRNKPFQLERDAKLLMDQRLCNAFTMNNKVRYVSYKGDFLRMPPAPGKEQHADSSLSFVGYGDAMVRRMPYRGGWSTEYEVLFVTGVDAYGEFLVHHSDQESEWEFNLSNPQPKQHSPKCKCWCCHTVDKAGIPRNPRSQFYILRKIDTSDMELKDDMSDLFNL